MLQFHAVDSESAALHGHFGVGTGDRAVAANNYSGHTAVRYLESI
jgi:hypothetical protein